MSASRYVIESLQRGLNVLTLFTRDAPEHSLTEIADAAGLSKTTAFRIASTLESGGYLERDPATKRFRPGLKVLQLGFVALSSMDLRQVARPHLKALAERTGETVSHGVLDGLEIVYVDRIRNRQIVGVVLGLGSRLPAACTSMGKSMLAYLPHQELQRRIAASGLQACTEKTIVNPDALTVELERIRARGYAVNEEELAIGMRAVAAPLWGADDQVIGAINISGSTTTISLERLETELAPQILQTARTISQALGYPGGAPDAA